MKIFNALVYLTLIAPLSMQTMDKPKNDFYVDFALAASSNELARVKSMLEMPGIDINTVDSFGANALHYAVSLSGSGVLKTKRDKDDNITIIRLLLDRPEVDTNVLDGNGKTALDLLLDSPHPSKEVKTLLRYAGAKTSGELKKETSAQRKNK